MKIKLIKFHKFLKSFILTADSKKMNKWMYEWIKVKRVFTCIVNIYQISWFILTANIKKILINKNNK